MKVLFGVDIQNDFCPGGLLPVTEGDAVVAKFNAMKRVWDECRRNGSNDVVMVSRDMHPAVTSHFNNWPVHCVAGTPGAEFHPDLDTTGVICIEKGTKVNEDAYSAFEGHIEQTGQPLKDYLLEHNVTEIIFCGLATDYCVLNTVVDACEQLPGVKVIVVIDAIRAVDINPGDGERAIAQMRAKGAVFMTTDEVVERLASRD